MSPSEEEPVTRARARLGDVVELPSHGVEVELPEDPQGAPRTRSYRSGRSSLCSNARWRRPQRLSTPLSANSGPSSHRRPNRIFCSALGFDDYDFDKHRRIAGHIPARDGDELMRMCAGALAQQPHQPSYAATGLAAAWCMGRYAAFRMASVYVHHEDALDDLRGLSFRPTERGANVWILVPADCGVFQGVATWDGVHCVAPVQVYLDLHAHPERARDVALEVRQGLLDWSRTE